MSKAKELINAAKTDEGIEESASYYKSEMEGPIMDADQYGCTIVLSSSGGKSKNITLNKESAGILINLLKKKFK